MLRRYGVMGRPRDALRVLAARGGAVRRADGQGPHGEGAGRAGCGAGTTPAACRRAPGLPRACATSASARPWRCAEPGAGRAEVPGRGQPPALAAQLGQPSQRLQLAHRGGEEAALEEGPRQRPDLDRRDSRDRRGRHELELGGEPVAGDEARVLGPRVGEARLPDGVADVPDDGRRNRLESASRRSAPARSGRRPRRRRRSSRRSRRARRRARGATGRRRRRRRTARWAAAARAAAAPRRPPRSRDRRGSATGRRCRRGRSRGRPAPRPPAAGSAAARRPGPGRPRARRASPRRSPARAPCRR